MRRSPTEGTEIVGVATCRLAVQKGLGWLFREQFTSDYGIDAQAEAVVDGMVDGRLLALQIKSGTSYFAERAADGWWYRPDADHVSYWRNHVLPVAIVLVDPESGTCFWELVNPETLSRSKGGGWKLLVPEVHILDQSAAKPLLEAMTADPYVLRIRELRLARPWIEMLHGGRRLVVEIEEWVNKLSGKGYITLAEDGEDGTRPAKLAEWEVWLGGASYAEVVPMLFAWADFSIHPETYEDADQEQFESECVFEDEEGDRFESMDYSEWRASANLEGLRPYRNVQGEADLWRLELTLNDVGKAFLLIDAFALSGDRQLTI
jgi:hypothetical protein